MPKILTSLLFSLVAIVGARAHEVGESYLFLDFEDDKIIGRIEIRGDDLNEKLGLDVTREDKISEALIIETAPKAIAYIRENLSIAASGERPYAITNFRPALFDNEGGWAQYHFEIPVSETPDLLDMTFTLFLEEDRMHRGIVVLEDGEWKSEGYEMNVAMVFNLSNPEQTLDINNPPTVQTPLSMIWQGVLHIWIGIDHILFLVALALPIVLIRRGAAWEPAEKLGPTLLSLIKVVTIFSIAHSITLALASLDIIRLPSRLVESVIALSIILVAINNFIGRSHKMSFLVVLALGLFHGLGFASVMSDLPFRIAELQNFVLIILAFNFGVEVGQLAILVVLFPVLFALRKSSLYTPVVLKGGSAILVLIAGYWFIERAFAL